MTLPRSIGWLNLVVCGALTCAVGCGSNDHPAASSPPPSEVAGKVRQALDPTWTPAGLSPAAWYVASSSPYDVVLQDGLVYQWVDHAGGHNATQDFYWGRPHLNSNPAEIEFDGGQLLRFDSWSGPPAGVSQSFTVLAVLRSFQAQDAGVVSWWDINGGGVAWAGLKNTNGQTLLDLTRIYQLGPGQMLAGAQDLGHEKRHVLAWRYTAETETLSQAVDGTIISSTNIPAIHGIPEMPLLIGATSYLPTGLFHGAISELVILQRSALDEEIQTFTEYARNHWPGIAAQSSSGPCVDASGLPSAESTRCDDGDPATYADHCSAGTCRGTTPRQGSPAVLSPVAWFHASADEVILTGGGVSTWFDRSENHNDIYQSFYYGRPVLDPTGWNGKPTIRFDNSAIWRAQWSGSPTGDNAEFTVLAVVNSRSTATAGIASWWHGDGQGQVACRLKNEGGTFPDLFRYDPWGNQQEFTSPGDIGNGKHVVVWRYSPEAVKLTVDGATTVTTPNPSPLGTISPDAFLIGATSYLPTNLFSGELSELAVVPSSICDSAVSNFVRYAYEEWGGFTPASTLPSGCGSSTHSLPLDPPDCPFAVPPVAIGRNGHTPSNTPRFMINAGFNPTFELGTDWENEVEATAVAFGDFVGDGKQELAVGRSRHDGGRLIIYRDSTLNFRPSVDLLTNWGDDFGVTAIATGDIDGDHVDEIAVARNEADGGGIEITILDDANHGYAVMKEIDVGNRNVSSLAMGDADNDGDIELIAGRDGRSGSSAGRVLVIQGPGGNYASTEIALWGDSDRGATAVAIGDLEGDGKHEIAVARSAGGNSRLQIIRYDNQRRIYVVAADFNNTWGDDRYVTALAFGDLDGNGDDELVAGRNGGGGPRLFVYDTPISNLTPRELKHMGDGWGDERSVRSLAVGDVDFDGRAEIYAGRSVGGGPRVIVFNDALDDYREMDDFGEGWGDDREARSIAIGKQLICESRPAPPTTDTPQPSDAQHIPDTVDAADAEFGARRKKFLDYWITPAFVQMLESKNGAVNGANARDLFGDWGDAENGDKLGVLKRLLAGAAAIHFDGTSTTPSARLVELNLHGFIDAYLRDPQNIRMTNDVGTDPKYFFGDAPKTDFDFNLVQMAELAYFLEPLKVPGTNDSLVSDDALRHLLLVQTMRAFAKIWADEGGVTESATFLVDRFGGSLNDQISDMVYAGSSPIPWDALVIPYTGNGPTHLAPVVSSLNIQAPETENHVLMIHTWMYLMNQWVASGKRGIPALFGGLSAYQNANSPLETFLLAAVGRFLKNGSWETNARPYQAYTVRALEVLASYADEPMRTGATNALDALAAKYAFQSLDAKRAPPIRRHYAHRSDTGIYMNDYLEGIFGVLSGAVVYNTDPQCSGWLCITNGRLDALWPFAFGLDSVLSNYRLPKTIHDLMLHPDNHQTGFGIWSRIQERYTEQHYLLDTKPRYPLPDGFDQPDLNAQIAAGTLAIEPAQEFYFVTQDFLNVAGSRTEHYAGFEADTVTQIGEFLVPSKVEEFVYGTDFWRKPTALIGNRDLGYWTMREGEGQETLVADGDHGVYKNFVYAAANGLDPKAVRIPDHWRKGPSAQIGDATFFVVDSTSTRSAFNGDLGSRAPYYLVVGELPPSWGTWEVVPAAPYANEQALLDHVLAVNSGNVMNRNASYEYTLAVSGEKLALNPQFPGSTRVPFTAIDGSAQAVRDNHLMGTPALMPLMDARQVNGSYQFTGKSYACGSGDGRLVISNPQLHSRLVLDARDHLHPTRIEDLNAPAGPDPCDNGFVVDSVVSGNGGGLGGG